MRWPPPVPVPLSSLLVRHADGGGDESPLHVPCRPRVGLVRADDDDDDTETAPELVARALGGDCCWKVAIFPRYAPDPRYSKKNTKKKDE